MKYKAVIFDLDGVIVSTDNLHYTAWKKMADNEDIYFDKMINERLRGVSRMESLEIILENAKKKYSVEKKQELAEFKNNLYIELIKTLTPKDILIGVEKYLNYLKNNNIKIAIGSSSKNTKLILEQIGMKNYFDIIVDGNDIKKSKPSPEVYQLSAEKLNLKNSECLVIEDAVAGVKAGLKAGSDVLAVSFASQFIGATFKCVDLNQEYVYKILD